MKISLIVPTYNREHLIENAINGFLKQTYSNIELIIIDDCSTDNTQQIIHKMSDSRIKYFRNNQNYGADNLQILRWIEEVQGDFVTFMSDDDLYPDNEFFQKIVDEIKKHDDVDIVSGKIETVYNKKILQNNVIGKKIYSSEEILNDITMFKQFAYGGNTIFRTTLFKKDIIPREHDLTSIFKLIYKSRKIIFINEVFYFWNLSTTEKSFSATLMKNTYKGMRWNMKFIDEIYHFLELHNECKKYEKVINAFIFDSFDTTRMNYQLTQNSFLFSNLLNKLDRNKKIYIYGKGMVGLELESYLASKDIYIGGFIDDVRKDEDTKDLNDIEKDSIIIIAIYKDTILHKIYKKIIESDFHHKNIIELV